MKAKRTTGESAQRILCTHVALEHCHVKGCKLPVLITRNFDGTTKQRACAKHMRTKAGKGRFDVTKALKFPWQ